MVFSKIRKAGFLTAILTFNISNDTVPSGRHEALTLSSIFYIMVVLRLTRMGRKNKATFRIVAQDKLRAPNSRALEIVGSYNPHLPSREQQIQLDTDRIRHWLDHGAQPSATVHNILVERGILQAKKRRSVHAAPKVTEQPVAEKIEEKITTPEVTAQTENTNADDVVTPV